MFDDRPPDTTVRYRRTNAGYRVAVLPATCKVGTHSLSKVGYTAHASDAEGVVRISCRACNDAVDVDHFWVLTLRGAPPRSAELDDGPYRDVVPVMIDPRGRGLPPTGGPV
ncbi:hypothetical protein JOD54_001429 [Actinokineospora baliensis]|uniref:hypothetical protein n=1 Tax=Actinokineospora baliensis TaxID=547056 RepID=UPI00195CA087|nr:hypothetical protein [Actinokineospora baliensis]MBM7771225.1 hypothetical protein [Actinokineospora baliensis]